MIMGVGLDLAGVALMFEGMRGPVRFRLWVKIAMIPVGLGFIAAVVRLACKKRPQRSAP